MKKRFIPLLVILSSISLTACGTLFGFDDDKKKDPITPEQEEDEEDKNVLPRQKMSFVCSDLNNTIAPSKGDVKMLVVPITFAGDTIGDNEDKIVAWTDARIEAMNNYYFGATNSLAKYYDNASFGALNVTGMVSDIYENTTYSIDSVMGDYSYQTLFNLIEDAVTWLQDTNSDIDWSEYDANSDGCIDNVHLITDYHCTEWSTPLWPHKYQTGRIGTLERPLPNVYSISGTYFVTNAITAIHEQGHIFGLQDYYDYSDGGESEIDYVGHLDMQSRNCFDWNSYSKLSMGWVEPYVMTNDFDKVEVKLQAASLNGDCLIIPADSDTWNKSAFDEYFLIELFAPYGNNEHDWQSKISTLGSEPGVRMYHVDSRAYGGYSADRYSSSFWHEDDFNNQQINSLEDIEKYPYNTVGANNSSDWSSYPAGIPQLGDYPLLSVVQKGGSFTFASTYGRHELYANDLFKEGDKFTFSKYSKFCNKNAEAQELTNKGEEFPYEIDFGEITDTTVTLTIKRVK